MMKMKRTYIYLLLTLAFVSCEKEIDVEIPGGYQEQLVVEASINTRFPLLNYVFISKTMDYFKPDLSLNGVKGATVYMTEGTGGTQSFDQQKRVRLFPIDSLASFLTDSTFKKTIQSFSGVYMSFDTAGLRGKANHYYLLEIFLPDGRTVTGTTYIPNIVTIDSLKKRVNPDKPTGKDSRFLSFQFVDGPGQDNYRMAVNHSTDSLLFGWGGATFFRTFDDEFLNNGIRPYEFANPWEQGDTINIYFTHIGRPEFLFWQSFGRAANSGGPFSTPATVKSNIKGAIGSFTGYAVDFRQIILD